MSDNDLLLSESIRVDTQREILVLTLNRPKVLNALNLQLAKQLYQRLIHAQDDQRIICILLQGAGERGFCAGGDIKAMYASAIATPGGPCIEAEQFFEQEYQLDYLLHQYTKPVIAWGHGVVMGGGMGLLQACSHRVLTPTSKLAMPEVTIALYPDVAACYFLNKLAKPWGRFLALSGAAINATESVELGLADVVLAKASQASLLSHLVAAFSAVDMEQQSDQGLSLQAANSLIDTVLHQLDIAGTQQVPITRLPDIEKTVQTLFSINHLNDLVQEVQRLSKVGTHPIILSQAFETMLHASPLSLCNTDRALDYTQTYDLKSVFKFDLMFAVNIIRHPEFAEGVRALLIDKDQSPRWLYSSVEQVPQAVLDSMMIAPWDIHPFADW